MLTPMLGVGHPGVPVADVGGEELDEALRGAVAGVRDRGRQAVDAGPGDGHREGVILGVPVPFGLTYHNVLYVNDGRKNKFFVDNFRRRK